MCDVLVSTGVVSHLAFDVAMPGRPPFDFVCSYSTVDTASGAMGLGWRHNWEVVTAIYRYGEDQRLKEGRELLRRETRVINNSVRQPRWSWPCFIVMRQCWM
jgi:uncharacterized protein DUF6531